MSPASSGSIASTVALTNESADSLDLAPKVTTSWKKLFSCCLTKSHEATEAQKRGHKIEKEVVIEPRVDETVSHDNSLQNKREKMEVRGDFLMECVPEIDGDDGPCTWETKPKDAKELKAPIVRKDMEVLEAGDEEEVDSYALAIWRFLMMLMFLEFLDRDAIRRFLFPCKAIKN
uniref:Uncharacterized protein n=1 Tax=Odontella aurita TaxID=265563 RepID=A0A7S4JA32_9STRA|mmetsp:Transcript_42212/g.128053  ORF Transcript_42212/g.128053 Transcript_42212/m.128053 type:complete len:175 (+) Transcript_42212:96-620(+)